MSYLALDNTTTSYGGLSRIPRPFVHPGQLAQYSGYRNDTMQNDNQSKKPSRLDQMQVNYQNKLLKEKEQRIIQMYEDNQQRALQKVNKKGMVRDFFNERRALGSGSEKGQNSLSPSMEHMYKQKKVEHQQSQPSFGYTGQHYTSQGLAQQMQQQSSPNGQYQPSKKNAGKYQVTSKLNTGQPHQSSKNSAGRDRSNLLAPIQKPGQHQDNPFPRKPQIVRPRTLKDTSRNKENYSNGNIIPKSAPTGNFAIDSDGMDDDTPPPNPKQLQALQQKRKLLQSQRSNKSSQSNQSKLSDFQKFQFEQDKNREMRLQKHREIKGTGRPSAEDEGYAEDDDSDQGIDGVGSDDDIKRKQHEILAQIESQQRELERLQKERAREEMEEAKEMERRKKLEEDRKRKLHDEEKRQRKMEEEDRVKREWDVEKARKMEEEKKRRLRKNSEKARVEYEDSDDEMNDGNYGNKPTPPPQPRPAQTRKPVPSKSTSKAPTRQPSPKMGEHTALYQHADQIEGAYEDTGRLVACYNCGRKFAEDRLEKHEQFCKNATKKRKVMDPSKLRTRGTEMEQYANHRQPTPKGKKSNWRAKHESFMNAIKYAKKVKEIEDSGGNLADLPPPPVTENPDYVQCPHCTRRFNPGTAERHIPHCKNTRSRPAGPPRRK